MVRHESDRGGAALTVCLVERLADLAPQGRFTRGGLIVTVHVREVQVGGFAALRWGPGSGVVDSESRVIVCFLGTPRITGF